MCYYRRKLLVPSPGQQWPPPCGTPAQLWDDSTSPLPLVVFEGRVPFSTFRIWSTPAVKWKIFLVLKSFTRGQTRRRGVDVGKTRANREGKKCDGHKWDWITPTRPQGVEVNGLCTVSSVKARESVVSFDRGDCKAMALRWKPGRRFWQGVVVMM